ncbi:hypothetical protein ACWENQ_17370 [Nonomuraea sp. NPDC004354]
MTVVQVFKNVGLNMELFLAALQGVPQELFEAARLDGYIAVVVTVGTPAVSTLAGYAFGWVRFRGSNVLFVIVLTGLLIPSEVTIVPLFQLFHGGGRPTRTGRSSWCRYWALRACSPPSSCGPGPHRSEGVTDADRRREAWRRSECLHCWRDHGRVRAEMLADLSAADPGMRAEALRWFATHGDSGDAAVVVPLVQDPGEFDDRDHDDLPESARTRVRMVALEALAQLRAPGMFAGVFDDALQDDDLRVRARAALGASAEALVARLAVEGGAVPDRGRAASR